MVRIDVCRRDTCYRELMNRICATRIVVILLARTDFATFDIVVRIIDVERCCYYILVPFFVDC